MFPELKTTPDDKSSVFSPDEREHGVLRVWKERNIFRRSVEDRDPKNSFSFYEGPPTVNGVPGIHHVFSRSIKDMICRYQTMLGKCVERKAGWDTHGLPVELAIEKQLGFRHKDQIKEYGVDKFNALCKASVYENIERDGGWKELTERMAYWADMEHPYITCTNDYIESVWWALKKFYDAGKIYKGFKIQPYCPRCETALSSHEVALGYKTAKDPSVFVKFKRKGTTEDEYFLAWTTTPWTLISNVALAVHPDVEYVTVINKRKNSTERLVLAKALLAKLDGEYEIVAEVKGSELEGAEYRPLFYFDALNVNPEDIGDMAIIAAAHIGRGIQKGAEFTSAMLGEFGEKVRPYIDSLYDHGQSMYDIVAGSDAVVSEAKDGEAPPGNLVYRTAAVLIRENPDRYHKGTHEGYDIMMSDLHQKFSKNNPDLTERQVRDAYVSYGRIKTQRKDVSRTAYSVVLGNYVTTDDGTGIVHTAPAFGEDDYQIAQQYNLPLINPVDKSGNFIDAVTDFAGQFIKEADPHIMEELKLRGLLYRKETIEHTYPFCWRCESPLIYYARDSWYIKVTDYKAKLSETNRSINWQPPEIRDGRFGNWLTDLKDWGISRERFWGTPLPIWTNNVYSATLCIGSYADLFKPHRVTWTRQNPIAGMVWGSSDPEPASSQGDVTLFPYRQDENGNLAAILLSEELILDLHKPVIDSIHFLGVNEHGATIQLSRVPDVIDVWFDSGSMPFAQHHYMADGEPGSIPPPPGYPAQFISEGIDQTRGWFYTLHAINTFLFGKPPYENVIVNDMLLDKKGQKMSKSKGNILNPFEILSKYGADATRWYLISSSVPWKPKAFNEDDLADVERKFFGTLINTYSFFALYSNIDKFEYNAGARVPIADRPEVDRWILSELNSLVLECRKSFDAYDLTKSARAIQEFVVEQLSNWYVRRNRRRFWKGERNTDKQAAYETLYECLLTISKLMAPLAPFFSDWLYEVLRAGSTDGTHLDSVHLDLYPEADAKLSDIALEARMKSAQTISSLVRQMRERAKIKVRQPLERILIPVANRRQVEELRKVEDVIREEINVKRVEFIESGDSDVIKLKAKANFKTLGTRLGKQMKSVAKRVTELTQDEIRVYQQEGSIKLDMREFYLTHDLGFGGDELAQVTPHEAEHTVTLERGDIDVIAEDVEGWLVSTDGGITVALDTHISDQLMKEGLAREFVNRIQNLRKDSGFDVTDRIHITLLQASDVITAAVQGFGTYIKEETLATSLTLPSEVASDGLEGTLIELGDESISVGLTRVALGS